MLTLLARCGRYLLLGDRRGRTHLVQVLEQDFGDGDLGEPIRISSVAQARAALSPVTIQVQGRVSHPQLECDVLFAFAEGTWFVRIAR